MHRCLLFWLAVASSATVLADEVYLKGGGKLSGRVVQKTATSVAVDVGAGKVTVPADRVERIVEGRSALDAYYERAGALAPNDREGWAALARWASDRSLATQSREAWNRVAALDPGSAEANEALGNVEVNGRWMSEDAGYQARGYVRFDGEWMTPAEAQAIERERALADSDRARAQAEARARQAEARAEEAEAKAKEAEAREAEAPQQGIPLWWGWGPGPVLWPTQPVVPAPQPGAPPKQPR